jgi:hypothetical protein
MPCRTKAQGAPPVSLTPGKMGKIFYLKNFNNLVWTPLGSTVNIYNIFAFKFLQPDIVLITASVIDTGGNLPSAANLPPISSGTGGKIFRRCL